MRKEHRVSEKSLKNLEKGIPMRFNSETGALYARKGQEASVRARRRNKSLSRLAVAVGNTRITDSELLKTLNELGIKDEEEQYNALIVAGVLKEASQGKITAVEKWEDWLDREEEDLACELEQIEDIGERALALARANYIENINSGFGTISAYALKHRYTHYEASGGRGSGKSSWASLTVVRLVMEHPDVHALVMRKVANTLRDSVYTQYQWAIEQLGVSEFWEARKSPLELIYRPTGQKILFRGADDPMKIKSIKPPFGYIGITHFEEKDQFAGRTEIDSILQSTMRGGREFWNFETYNPPRSKDNWANKDSREERPNRVRHQSTYLDLDDPDWLGEAFIAEAEDLRQRDEGRYQNEYLGIPVGIGGSVFENLELRVITDEELRRFDRIFQGVDWGWFPDPYAFVRLHYDKTRETIYLIDEHFGNKLTNEQSAKWILEHGYNDVPTTCDSAEPKSVSDYRSLGVNAKEAIKGPSSVDYGMKWLQSRTIVIDKRRTPHAYEEFVNYEFEKNRADEWISGYPDKNNHTIDAVRYALERVSNKYRSQA
ncbi:MAG: PBSX family phage terminase large subunit [Oscillospiraceae bacterium]|nr:PBSX family phage terminase large subunit [Oscillospiraceae bacterium]